MSLGVSPNLALPQERLAQFCQLHHIRKLSLLGSVLRSDFTSDSDVDMLVEFEPEHIPGLIRLAAMELELSRMVKRKLEKLLAEI